MLKACHSLLLLIMFPGLAPGDCISISEAKNHIGETRCIAGKVVRVQQGNRGVHYLDFCEDYRVWPFTVVVFPHDLRSVGDIRQLQGRVVEVHGAVKEYDGRAEIILEEARQLGGGAGRLPALPKNFDVENKGRYSPGKFSHPKAKHAAKKKRHPAKLPIEVPEDEEPD